MNSRKTEPIREQDHPRSENAAERRFNETVRNLLNTPHKPHKGEGKPPPKPGRDSGKPASRRGVRG
jgi:hypothetical protein